jgi:invasion protein IalB
LNKTVAFLAGAGLLAVISFAVVSQEEGDAGAQGKQEAGPEAGTNEAPASGWRTSCAASERDAPLACVLEQSIFVPNTRQQLVNVKIQFEGGKKQPTLLITAPLGLFLPAGVSIRVDQAEPETLDLQTCDAAGCYVAMAVSDELLGLLKAGNDFSVTFQDLAKQDINVTMPLQGFSDGLAKVH